MFLCSSAFLLQRAEKSDFDRCRSSEIGSSWKNENTEICSRTGTLPVRSGNSGGCHLFYQCKELLHDLFRPVSAESGRASGGKNFRSLLNALRKVYDYVIVDTPPLGSVIDSAIVAEICDGSIMVIESGVISYRFAQEVKSQLERSNCPLLGVVLNKVDMQKQAYGKYGKYGQYKYGDYGQEEDD